MSISEVLACSIHAWALLVAHPFLWLSVTVAFLVAVEALMFIPYVGFSLKLAAASVVGAGILGMFATAAAGHTPSLFDMLHGFSLPAPAQVALVASALLPFAAGLLYLHFKSGPSATAFFFGNIFKIKPPPKELFVRFKQVMLVAALPLSLLPGVVVLQGLSGFPAVSAALSAAAVSWIAILLFAVSAAAFESLAAALPSLIPKPVAVATTIVLLVPFITWSFALTYTVSAKAFASHTIANAANHSFKRTGLRPAA